jgi:hypothetical protein
MRRGWSRAFNPPCYCRLEFWPARGWIVKYVGGVTPGARGNGGVLTKLEAAFLTRPRKTSPILPLTSVSSLRVQ